MPSPDSTSSARNFVRSLNVVSRQASLYGLQHKLVSSQFEFSFQELQKALAQRDRLMLVPANERLLLDGVSLGCGSAEKALSQLFVSAGIAALSILPGITKDEFGSFVTILGRSKPSEVFAQLRGDGSPRSVRPIGFNELGEVSSDRPQSPAGFGSDFVFTLLGVDSIAARGIGGGIDSPAKLLQLASAAEPGSTAPALGVESLRESTPLQEDEVARVIRWLGCSGASAAGDNAIMESGNGTTVGGANALDSALQEPAQLSDFPPLTQMELRTALSAALSQAKSGTDQSLLVSLAEHLALRASLRKFQSGDASYNAVQQLLDRLKRDIQGLRDLVHEHDVPGRESWADALDRKFWESVPAHEKSKILTSQAAWCVPPANLRSYLTELIAKGDEPQCDNILRSYCRLLNSPEPGAAESVAAGLAKLADLYSRNANLLEWTLRQLFQSMTRCPDACAPHLLQLFAALVKEAESKRNYSLLCDCLGAIEALRGQSEDGASRLAASIDLNSSVPEYLDLALGHDAPPVMRELLRLLPDATAKELARRFTSANRRTEAAQIKVLADDLGPAIVDSLMRAFAAAPADISVLGLMCSLDYSAVTKLLPSRLGEFSCAEQAQVVSQLARTLNSRGSDLLLLLLDRFHPWVVPLALDEISLSERSDARPLLELVQGQGLAVANPFVQLKAIEAAGRVQLRAASEILLAIVKARSLLSWRYAQEIRIAAMHAVLRLDPRFDRSSMVKLGFSHEDLQLAPLRLNSGQWIRQRRYPRIPLNDVMATITASSGGRAATAIVNVMSMRGGFCKLTNSAKVSGEATVEIPFGIRRLRFQAVLAPCGQSALSFEIGSIDLETRLRLRKFLTAHAES
jgi:hypothetical protein